VGQTPSAPVVRPARRARGDRTRAALVAAAIELFGDKGVDATAVDEITAAAAVAKGTFYVHFQRKTDVLLEMAARTIPELVEGDGDGGSAADALRALADRLGERMGAWPREVMGRMVREIVGNREDWLRVLGDRPTLAQVVPPVVERGQASGELRADLSPERQSQALTILLLDGVIGWAERTDERPLAVDLARATELFLGGALARP
jgi:AcrR family transcriptional regulator